MEGRGLGLCFTILAQDLLRVTRRNPIQIPVKVGRSQERNWTQYHLNTLVCGFEFSNTGSNSTVTITNLIIGDNACKRSVPLLTLGMQTDTVRIWYLIKEQTHEAKSIAHLVRHDYHLQKIPQLYFTLTAYRTLFKIHCNTVIPYTHKPD
jgi:hypothetical protein